MKRRRWHHVISLAVVQSLCVWPASPAKGDAIAGHAYPIHLETPQDYAGLAEGPSAHVAWSHVLRHPGASYIAVHFDGFDLGPGDYLRITDGKGGQVYELTGQGKMNAGTFWARHVKGDTAVIEFVIVGPDGGAGFVIDQYAAGDVPSPLEDGGVIASQCGANDRENAICYETTHPTKYDRSRAVARLLISGTRWCTGSLVGPNHMLLTNAHCIDTAGEALNADYEFMAEAPACGSGNCTGCWTGTVFSGGTLIRENDELDYGLVQISTGSPSDTYGYLEIDDRVAVVGEQIYMPQHPVGRAKELALFSSHPDDTGGVCRIASITEPSCLGGSVLEIGYYADTEGGSSGSPIIATSSHKIIALHHCGGCPNRGFGMDLIYPEIEDYLIIGTAGTISFGSDPQYCEDLLQVTVDDVDLLGDGMLDVVAITTSGDTEDLALIETPADSGIFTLDVPTAQAAATDQDGTLQVAHADTITVYYQDAAAGGAPQIIQQGVSVDCSPAPDFDRDGDVDIADYGHLQACYSGPNVTQSESTCLDALLDPDDDVDQDDFAVFELCLTGSHLPADIMCMP